VVVSVTNDWLDNSWFVPATSTATQSRGGAKTQITQSIPYIRIKYSLLEGVYHNVTNAKQHGS
jgi:hypothetical protein